MICSFDICEFYNLLIGGIFIGVLASFIFLWMTNFLRNHRFKQKYKYLESISAYDWTAYSMRDDNGRAMRDEPNGSKLHIEVRDERIILTVKQKDSRTSIGELRVNGFEYGLVTFKYENDHEYGKRECIIGHYIEKDEQFDYLFTIPLNDKIYYIDTSHKNTAKVHYHYGNEIFIRKSTNR